MDHYWLTTQAVAQMKGVTRTAVAKALKEGRLAGRKFGRDWFVKDYDADAWEPKAGWPKGRPRPKRSDTETAGSD